MRDSSLCRVTMSSADPRTVIIGEGVIVRVGDLLGEYRHPLIVTDEQVYSRYGVSVDELLGIKDEWLMVSQYDAGSKGIKPDIDIILGFGGGRSIDIAKLLARDNGLDWMAIPTAASHDGIASDVASVSHTGYRYSEKCKSPIAVVGDLSIVSEAPPRLRLAGIGDIICKTSSLAEWRLGHEKFDEPFDDGIFSFVSKALDSVLNTDNLETLIRAQIDCGKAMSQFGSSRPCSGTEHAISHAMDRDACDLHGLQVAFTTPLCLHFLNEVGYSKHSANSVIEFMRKRGMPTSLGEMSIPRNLFLENIHHALRIMEKRGRYSVLKHANVSDQEIGHALINLNY